MSNEDKPVILSNVNKKQIGMCVICQIPLNVINYNEETKSDLVLKCKDCKREYYPSSEMMEYQDVLVSPHDSNPNVELEGIGMIGPTILFSDDDNEFSNDDDEKKKSGFYSMDYLKRTGVTVEVKEKEQEENN